MEILLDSKQTCNLTTIDLSKFVEDDHINLDKVIKSQQLSTRIGVRMTLVDLELENWSEIQKRDRLIGVSLTGYQDALEMAKNENGNIKVNTRGLFGSISEEELLDVMHKTIRYEADNYSKELRIASPLLTTTVKPEGTLSQVAGGVSSGLHFSHSPYYIRRIRIASNDPLAKTAISLGWNVNAEVGTPGETNEEKLKNAKTLVIDFPIKSGSKITKDEVSALEQLEVYFKFQKYYTEHNSSNTITVKPDEWQMVKDEIYDNWDDFVGVSFLSHDGGTYQLAPYEAITEEKYIEMKSKMKKFDPFLLMQFETNGESDLEGMDGCEGGACPIR